MARKGRELELLIQKLEKMVLPVGATINSPAFINDKITNQPREVDILIEYTVGTSNLKIVIECRDRIATQDTTWIEQMGFKIRDLNIYKAIAVSSSPFSKPAKEKAKFYGIETRTLSEISPEIIADWWSVEYLQAYTHKSELVAVAISLGVDLEVHESITEVSNTDKILFRKTDNQAFALVEAIPLEKTDVWSQCIANEPPIRAVIECVYENPADRFYIKRPGRKTETVCIMFHLDLMVIKKSLPISKVAEYAAGEVIISHVIDVEGININGSNTLQLIKNQNGTIAVSFLK